LSYRLFVRDFAPQTDIRAMEVMFSAVGHVSKATLSETEYKNGPRQVAYIEMSSSEEMQDCIDRFHGMRSDGFVMTVTEDKVHVPNPNYVFKRPKKAQSVKPKAKPTKLKLL
jgi:hypothetical protein